MASLKQHFDDKLARHIEDVRTLLDTFRKDVEQRCDQMQEDLNHSVREELTEIEDRVMRNLTEAPLTANLTFPQHPWY